MIHRLKLLLQFGLTAIRKSFHSQIIIVMIAQRKVLM